MSTFWKYIAVTVFAVFVGSQITEGAILVPYWMSMPAQEFYSFYSVHGPSIGMFYTILTIIAAIIPITIAIYSWKKKKAAFTDALISALFAIGFILAFYIYFKGANEQFYAGTLTADQLYSELITWRTWHWGRVVIECLSLLFLIRALQKID